MCVYRSWRLQVFAQRRNLVCVNINREIPTSTLYILYYFFLKDILFFAHIKEKKSIRTKKIYYALHHHILHGPPDRTEMLRLYVVFNPFSEWLRRGERNRSTVLSKNRFLSAILASSSGAGYPFHY